MTRACLVLLAVMGALALPLSAQVTYPDIAYYTFNEGSGTTINNIAIGATAAQPTWEAGTGGVWDTTAPRLGGAAMDIAGLDRLMSNISTDLSNDFTLECWIRTNFDTTTQLPCGTGQPSWCTLGRLWGDYSSGMGLFRCYIGFYNDGANFLGGGFPSLGNGQTPANNVVADTNWHHIALVYDFDPMAGVGTLTSYVDGNLDQQATAVPPGSATGTGNFHLGGQQGTGAPFNGSVDEFRWWSVARTQTEIQNNMNMEIPSPQPVRALFSTAAGYTATGPSPHLVVFQDNSTSNGGTIATWLWDFGDGNMSTDQNPCHVYTATGVYNVTLNVTDNLGRSDTYVANAFVNVGNPAFVAHTCGLGDLYLGAPPPPAGWVEGYTLISGDTANPAGFGPVFGLYADFFTWTGLANPAAPGNPLHFINIGNPNIYPEAPFVLPAGALTTGITLDAVVIYLDGIGNLISFTGVSRTAF